jgi:hypothetical protein
MFHVEHSPGTMQTTIRLPLDLTQISPFREIKNGLLGDVGEAHTLWWELWRELGYHAQEGVALGRLPGENVAGFKASLIEQGLDGDAGFDLLLKARVLVADGDDFTCPRFALLNSDFRLAKRESVGAYIKNFNGRQKKMEDSLLRQATLISESKFVDEADCPLDPDMTRKVTRLIISCDNALFKPERPSVGFTEGLIQDALRVAKKLTDDEINSVLYAVAYKRTHPALNGMTTERLLPQFGELARKLQD